MEDVETADGEVGSQALSEHRNKQDGGRTTSVSTLIWWHQCHPVWQFLPISACRVPTVGSALLSDNYGKGPKLRT